MSSATAFPAAVPRYVLFFCGVSVLAISADPDPARHSNGLHANRMQKGRREAGVWQEGVLPAAAPVGAVGWPGMSTDHPAVNTNLGAGVVAMAHGNVLHFWDTFEQRPADKFLNSVNYMEPDEYARLPPPLLPPTDHHPSLLTTPTRFFFPPYSVARC